MSLPPTPFLLPTAMVKEWTAAVVGSSRSARLPSGHLSLSLDAAAWEKLFNDQQAPCHHLSSSTVVRGWGGSDRSACSLAEEDGGADGSVRRSGGHRRVSWWSPPAASFGYISLFSVRCGGDGRNGVAATVMATVAGGSSAMAWLHPSVSGENSSGGSTLFLPDVHHAAAMELRRQ